MKKLIRLNIEKLSENGEIYFLATSDDVQGLVVEGKTLEETIDLAYEVAKDLIQEQKLVKPSFLERYSYSLMVEA